MCSSDLDGLVNTDDVEISSSTKECVEVFLKCFGMDDLIDKVNIQELSEASISLPSEPKKQVEEVEEIDPEEATRIRVESMGVVQSINGGGKKIYFRFDDGNPTLMSLVKKTIETNPGDIEVLTYKGGEKFSTGLKVSAKAYPKLLQLYLNARNMAGRM